MQHVIPFLGQAAYRQIFDTAPRDGLAAYTEAEERSIEWARYRYQTVLGLVSGDGIPASVRNADRAANPDIIGTRAFDPARAERFMVGATRLAPAKVRAFLYLEVVELVASGLLEDKDGERVRHAHRYAVHGSDAGPDRRPARPARRAVRREPACHEQTSFGLGFT